MLLNMLNDRDLDWFFKSPIMADQKVTRYPLTNLGMTKDKNLHIEVAVAGFSKEDIEMELKGNHLIIKGMKSVNEDNEDNKVEYLQQHISTTSFSRVIVLHDNYVGGEINATVKDGILTINVEPKEQQKKLITIN